MIKTMFNWGVENELVPVDIANTLRYVKSLRAGETDSPESNRSRGAVDFANVERVLPWLPPTLRDMVLVHYETGARPSEVCEMRACEIDRTREVWIFFPESHKNKWRKKKRFMPLTQKAREIVERRMAAVDGDYLFPPAESDRERREIAAAKRKSKVQPSQKKRHELHMISPLRVFRPHYNSQSYARAIKYAIIQANEHLKEGETPVEHWTPYQLRHTAITEVSLQFGEESAQIFAGHSSMKTTDIYDHSKLQKAIEISKLR